MSIQSDFELLFSRPKNYFRLSAERQWSIDKSLGILDLEITDSDITPEMRERFNTYFDLNKRKSV